MYVIRYITISCCICQRFDAVIWATGRACGPVKSSPTPNTISKKFIFFGGGGKLWLEGGVKEAKRVCILCEIIAGSLVNILIFMR